jgi:hypothetical protein
MQFQLNQTYALTYNGKKRFILVKKVLSDRMYVLDYNVENIQERTMKTFLLEKCKSARKISFVVPDEDLDETLKRKKTIIRNDSSEDESEDEKGEFFDTTHFPPSLEKYPFRGRGIYCLDGKVVEEFGFPSLEVYSMQKLEVKADPRSLEMPNAEILQIL